MATFLAVNGLEPFADAGASPADREYLGQKAYGEKGQEPGRAAEQERQQPPEDQTYHSRRAR